MSYDKDKKRRLVSLEAIDQQELPLLAAKGDYLAALLLEKGNPLPEPFREEFLRPVKISKGYMEE